jgi:hypothetical protein
MATPSLATSAKPKHPRSQLKIKQIIARKTKAPLRRSKRLTALLLTVQVGSPADPKRKTRRYPRLWAKR